MLYIFFFKIIDKKKADYVLFCKKLNLYIKSTKLIHFHIAYYGQLLLQMWFSTAVHSFTSSSNPASLYAMYPVY